MAKMVLMLKNSPVLKFDIDEDEYDIQDIKKIPLGLQLTNNAKRNSDNFQHWCTERTLSMSAKHAKAIRTVLGLNQDNTDYTRSRIALSYHCLSLDDAYWTKKENEDVSWEEINLFQNKNRNALTPVSLQKDMSTLITGKLKNASDLGVDGTFAKSWVRENETLYLLKADDNPVSNETECEVCASKVLDCFAITHADYTLAQYNDTLRVSKSKIFTSEDKGLVKFKAYKKYCWQNGIDPLQSIKDSPLLREDYYKMCIATYLIGNEDLHDGNWGFLQDSNTGEIIGLAPLYDFNYAFTERYACSGEFVFAPENKVVDSNGNEVKSANTIDAILEYGIKAGRTQREVAMEAMKKVKFAQIKEITADMFPTPEHFKNFIRRASKIGLPVIYAKPETQQKLRGAVSIEKIEK